MAEPAPPTLWRTELGATLRLAAPLAAANLLQMLVYAIDVIFVARLGETALAASSLATTLFGLMMWCLIGLTGACAPLIAAELGRRAHAVREVRRSVRMALWLAVFATAITGLAILVNALGNYVLVFGNWGAPALGLDGSAISSVITACAMLGAYVLAIRMDRRLRRYALFGRWWRPEWTRLRDLLRIGLPISLIIMAEGGLFSSAAFLMGLLGQAELAGHTVALQVAALAFQIPFGVGQAATIRVGYHYGAGNVAAIAAAGKAALLVAVSYMIIPAALMILAPRFVLSLYVDPAAPANAAMVGHAVGFLAIAAAFQLFDGLQAVLAGTLRGLQDTRMPLILALIGYWLIGFTTSVMLGFFTPLAGNGIWLGLAAGLVVVSILLARRWQHRARLGLLPS